MRKIWNRIFGKPTLYVIIEEHISYNESFIETNVWDITKNKEQAIEDAKDLCKHLTAGVMGCWWHLDSMEMHEDNENLIYYYEVDTNEYVRTLVKEIKNYDL